MNGNGVLGKRRTGADVNGKHGCRFSPRQTQETLKCISIKGSSSIVWSHFSLTASSFCSETMTPSWKYSSGTRHLGCEEQCVGVRLQLILHVCVGERAHFSRQLTLASLAEPPSARPLQHPNNHTHLHLNRKHSSLDLHL